MSCIRLFGFPFFVYKHFIFPHHRCVTPLYCISLFIFFHILCFQYNFKALKTYGIFENHLLLSTTLTFGKDVHCLLLLPNEKMYKSDPFFPSTGRKKTTIRIARMFNSSNTTGLKTIFSIRQKALIQTPDSYLLSPVFLSPPKLPSFAHDHFCKTDQLIVQIISPRYFVYHFVF